MISLLEAINVMKTKTSIWYVNGSSIYEAKINEICEINYYTRNKKTTTNNFMCTIEYKRNEETECISVSYRLYLTYKQARKYRNYYIRELNKMNNLLH